MGGSKGFGVSDPVGISGSQLPVVSDRSELESGSGSVIKISISELKESGEFPN